MSEKIEDIRRRFRKETGKLDNWIFHRRITEYFKEADGDADKAS